MARKTRWNVVHHCKTKTEAQQVARGFRKAARRRGQTMRGKVKISRSGSGYAVLHYGNW